MTFQISQTLDFPTIVEKAASPDQARKQIKARLDDMFAHAENDTLFLR